MADPEADSREPVATGGAAATDGPAATDRTTSGGGTEGADADAPPSADDGGHPRVRALVVAVALSVGGPVIALLLVVLTGVTLRELGLSLSIIERTILGVVMSTGVGLGGVALLYLRVRPRLLAVRLPSLRDLLATGIGIGLMLGLVILAGMAIEYLQRVIGVQPAQNNVAELAGEDPTVLLVLIPLALLVIGPGEELLFRGAVQGRLREVFGAPAAVGTAAALFAAIHFAALVGPASGRFLTIAILFIPAAVLGAAYEYSGNLVVPALMHGVYDAVLFGLLYLVMEFGPQTEGGQGVEAVVVVVPT